MTLCRARPDRLALLRAEAARLWAGKLARAAESEEAERHLFPGRFCPVCGRRRDGTAAAHAPDCPRSLAHWPHRRGAAAAPEPDLETED